MLDTRHSFLNNFFTDTNYNDGVFYDKKEDQLMVYVDIPGVKKEGVAIEVIGNVVRINTEREFGQQKSKATKAFTINKKYNIDTAEAKLEDGVLQLILKEKESEKPKAIPIKVT